MLKRLVQPRQIWWPTKWGWLLLLTITLGLGGAWFQWAEDFLAENDPIEAQALIIEGWIGIEGIKAAKTEFDTGHYQVLITTGGPFESRWGAQHWNYAEEAYGILRRAGVPESKLIQAPSMNSQTQRTFGAALAMKMTLEARGLCLKSANIFTFGSHARRSRLVFSKILGPECSLGAISWMPAAYDLRTPWWRSSERAEDVLKESIGFPFELLLNSARLSNEMP